MLLKARMHFADRSVLNHKIRHIGKFSDSHRQPVQRNVHFSAIDTAAQHPLLHSALTQIHCLILSAWFCAARAGILTVECMIYSIAAKLPVILNVPPRIAAAIHSVILMFLKIVRVLRGARRTG